MEEIQNYVEEEKVRLKDQYRKASGHEVSKDFFVYACLEEEYNIRALGESSSSNLRWPGLFDSNGSSSSIDPSTTTLSNELRKMFQWYAETYQDLATPFLVDYENCPRISVKFALLTSDLAVLHRLFTQKDLPRHSAEEEQSEWVLIEALLREFFTPHFDLMMTFFTWKYSRPKEVKFDLASLPPVGRYFSILRSQSRRQSGDEEDRPFGSSRPGGFRRENRDDRPPQRDGAREGTQGRHPERSRSEGEREHSKSAPARSNHQTSDNGAPRGHHKRDERHSRGGKDQKLDKEAERERLAMMEVEKAVHTLKKQASVNEYKLKAQNSFIRRLQHKRINALGFKSTSVGEEDDRSVLITRA